MTDLYRYTFEHADGTTDGWSTQDAQEAEEYAQTHHLRLIENEFTFSGSNLIGDYTNPDDDEGEDDEEEEEGRDLNEVLDQLLAEIPAVEPYLFLRRRLVDLKGSVAYAAPEQMHMWWESAAACLTGELGGPTTPLKKRVAVIFGGEPAAKLFGTLEELRQQEAK